MTNTATDAGQLEGWHIVTNKRNQPVVYWFANGKVHLGSGVAMARTFIAEGCTIEPVEVCDKEALANQRATIATLTAQVATLGESLNTHKWLLEYLGKERDELQATVHEVRRQKNEAEEKAYALQQELAQATGQLLLWHYDTKHQWGYPTSEEVWANNPLRQRYKELTGADWVEPIEPDMDGDDDDN